VELTSAITHSNKIYCPVRDSRGCMEIKVEHFVYLAEHVKRQQRLEGIGSLHNTRVSEGERSEGLGAEPSITSYRWFVQTSHI
jgi:hypothetical protein